jgi:hypothetical protein
MISRHRQAEVRFYRALARTGIDPAVESTADEVIARVMTTEQRQAIAVNKPPLTIFNCGSY